MDALMKAKRFYDKFEEIVVVVLVATTTLLIFYQVVMRYVFSNSPAWSEEIARFLFVWETWLGISLTQKYNKHIKLEVLISKLTGKPLHICNIIADICTIAICVMLVYFGFKMMGQVFNMHQNASATHIPLWTVYLACPLSCALMSIRLLGDIKINLDLMRGKAKEVGE